MGGLCVAAGGDPGNRLALAACDGQADQTWATDFNGGFAPFIGIDGLCLDIEHAAKDNGAPLIVWPCHGGTNQSWALRLAELPQPTADRGD